MFFPSPGSPTPSAPENANITRWLLSTWWRPIRGTARLLSRPSSLPFLTPFILPYMTLVSSSRSVDST